MEREDRKEIRNMSYKKLLEALSKAPIHDNQYGREWGQAVIMESLHRLLVYQGSLPQRK